VLENVLPKILGYLNSQIEGNYLVAGALTLADIAIVSNFIVYQYMGFRIEPGQYPKLAKYLREIAALDVFQRALSDEQPFVEQMGLDSAPRIGPVCPLRNYTNREFAVPGSG
jgi:glutathione S-transferase